MRIGFYGHSTASWSGFPIDGVNSFIDKIIETHNAILVNSGVPQGSEERVLFELKKTKNIDLAIIFHSSPSYVFLPKCARDVSIYDAGIRKAARLWDQNPTQEAIEATKEKYFSYGNIKEVFEDIETFVSTMTLNQEYLYHPDLQMNRFIGALVQIDQYLVAKKIPAIHIYSENHIPSWFSFNSGIIANDVQILINTYNKSGFPNNLSAEGQQMIAFHLSRHINTLLASKIIATQ
jgi:hypothetical protein